LAFYNSLSEGVRAFFLPFGEVEIGTLRAHLASADAGAALSLGLVDHVGTVMGHCFVNDLSEPRPVLGIGLRDVIIGHGYGRRMMQAALAEADRMRLPVVTLTVVKANARAVRLYEQLGFVRTGETSFRSWLDSWCMERSRPLDQDQTEDLGA
jgi:RimJ/RimL family protein N-acetyltransferase